MRAFVTLRPTPFYRRGSFEAGLRRLGYTVEGPPRGNIEPDDVLVIWNRYGMAGVYADRARAAGATVIVCENGLVGRDRPDGHWYSMALDDPAHAGGRLAPMVAGEDRRAFCGVDSYALRKKGTEVIVLASRGIGPPGVASPKGWTEATLRAVRAQTDRPVRLRHHPGEGPRIPLEQDLANAWCVVTWASAAALQALLLGVPVFNCCGRWIGASAAERWHGKQGELEAASFEPEWIERTFEKVARGTWRCDEIESGMALARVLSRSRCTSSETTLAREQLPARSMTESEPAATPPS